MVIKPLNILGLYGGASLDGIKAEFVTTDGLDIFSAKTFRHIPYSENLFKKIRKIIGKKVTDENDKLIIEDVERDFSQFLASVVLEYQEEYGSQFDAIGLEGPTICHEPQNLYTYQLGKGRRLAEDTGFKVITHFHNADVLNGGAGSPITASYYQALTQQTGKSTVFINIGGVTTMNFIGNLGEILAFDCGPGTALIDDWMLKHAGMAMDYNGKFAATGHVHEKIVASLMKHGYFAKYPPKFISRDCFKDKIEHLEGLSFEDGAATATAFVCESIAYSAAFYLPEVPQQAILCGGGSFNPTLVRIVRQRLKDMGINVSTSKDIDIEINEAQAIAFLAARRLYNLPVTFPTTTGVAVPITGGEIYEKEA